MVCTFALKKTGFPSMLPFCVGKVQVLHFFFNDIRSLMGRASVVVFDVPRKGQGAMCIWP